MTTVDVVAFGPHPDDVDLNVGGTLLRLASQGYRCAIVDLTRGEMGTRGTPEMRAEEAAEAGRLLRVVERTNLGLPDGHVAVNDEAKDRVIRSLRRLRPTLILAPVEDDLHPDHKNGGILVREAAFLSGLRQWNTGQDPHRPRSVLGYANHTVFEPDLVIDVTEWFEIKRSACLAFASQFHRPGSLEPATYISGERFWDWWEARARHSGHRIGAEFGEAFRHDGPLRVDDPVALFKGFGYYP